MGVLFQNSNNPKITNFHNRKRCPAESRVETRVSGRRQPLVEKSPINNKLIMGQVKILKRGDPLTPPAIHGGDRVATENRKPRTRKIGARNSNDEILSSTKRLGPEPNTVQREIRVRGLNRVAEAKGKFAGSTVLSPPPSAVPVPSFLGKSVSDRAISFPIASLLM